MLLALAHGRCTAEAGERERGEGGGVRRGGRATAPQRNPEAAHGCCTGEGEKEGSGLNVLRGERWGGDGGGCFCQSDTGTALQVGAKVRELEMIETLEGKGLTRTPEWEHVGNVDKLLLVALVVYRHRGGTTLAPRKAVVSLGLELVGTPCVRCRNVSSQIRRSIFVGFGGPWDSPVHKRMDSRGLCKRLLGQPPTCICPRVIKPACHPPIDNADTPPFLPPAPAPASSPRPPSARSRCRPPASPDRTPRDRLQSLHLLLLLLLLLLPLCP